MKTKKYTVDDEHFVGSVETKLLSYPERLRLIAKMRTLYKGEGLTDESFELMARQVEIFCENVTGCEITHKESKQTFNDIAEIGLFNEGAQLINTLSAEFLKGESLGKVPATS